MRHTSHLCHSNGSWESHLGSWVPQLPSWILLLHQIEEFKMKYIYSQIIKAEANSNCYPSILTTFYRNNILYAGIPLCYLDCSISMR